MIPHFTLGDWSFKREVAKMPTKLSLVKLQSLYPMSLIKEIEVSLSGGLPRREFRGINDLHSTPWLISEEISNNLENAYWIG